MTDYEQTEQDFRELERRHDEAPDERPEPEVFESEDDPVIVDGESDDVT